MLERLFETIQKRRESPEPGSYTAYLFEHGLDKILKKVAEESAEVIIASKNDAKSAQICEIADLTYHLLVLLSALDLTPADIKAELRRREEKTKNLKEYETFDAN